MNTPHDTRTDDALHGDDLLAAELALGLLDRDARRGAQARMAGDTDFAARVAAWEARFAPWLSEVAPVPVPPALWRRIQAALGDARAPETAVRAGSSPRLRDRIAFWRGLAGGGFAVATASIAALLVVANRLPTPTTPTEAIVVGPAAAAPMVVALRHDDGTPAYSATVDMETGVIVLIPAVMPEDARVPQLWLIGADGKPHSLGVVPRDHAMRMTMPMELRTTAEEDGVFAVSMEPEGGSPHAWPTGPVVAKGNLTRL